MAFRRWFPRSLSDQAAFYRNFTKVFSTCAADLGFSAEVVVALEADNQVMQYLAQTDRLLKSFTKGFSKMRDSLTKGSGTVDKTRVYLQFTAPDEPPIVADGMFERLFKLADKITLAEGYTDVIGARLNILPKSGAATAAALAALRTGEMTPKIKAKAVYEARVEVRFTRGAASGLNLYFRYMDEETWSDLGKFLHSPVTIKIPLRDANKPEQIEVRGRYLIGNEPEGDFSNITTLVVAL